MSFTYDIRNCFIPHSGNVLVSIDYSNLELVSAANQLKRTYSYSRMCDTINRGNLPVDLHSILGCRLKNMSEGTNISSDEFIANKKKDGFAEYRLLAKPNGLSMPGGVGIDVMRGICAGYGIYPKYMELARSTRFKELQDMYFKYRIKNPNIRIRRLSKFEYALVYDELVAVKRELMTLYPELEKFLKQGHKKFLMGESRKVKNEFGEWEEEELYEYEVFGFKRSYCTYTACCNGYLMQSPSAVGATKGANEIVFYTLDKDDIHYRAFIHDENIMEIKKGPKLEEHIVQCATIMLHQMQDIMPYTRIAVEASIMDCWSKTDSIKDITFFVNKGSREVHQIG